MSQQRVHGDAEVVADADQGLQIRTALSGFPVGDRLSGNVEQICKLVLTQVFPFSQVLDLIAYVQFKSILLSEI